MLKLYEGKAKIIYSDIKDERTYIQHFKDDITAFNKQKQDQIQKKGIINNNISAYLFGYLHKNGIKTHFIRKIDERKQLIYKLDIIPVEIIIRNYAAGSLVKNLGFKEKQKLSHPIIEIHYKNDDLNDPLINLDHCIALNITNNETIEKMFVITHKINNYLTKLFKSINITMADLKLEFGFDHNKTLLLGDEISPDSCRLWNNKNNKSMDKDIFRNGGSAEDLMIAYNEIFNRLAKCE